MATQIANYQCPACTGPLHFQAESGKLACEFCGSVFPVGEIEKLYAEKEAQATEEKAKVDAQQEEARQEAQNAEEEGWDLSGLNSDWGADADSMRAYNCPSCGAELICEETTAATACPYCGNPSIVPGQFSGMLKPDYVIPFKLTKDAAIAKLKEHYKGRPLLPDGFKEENHLQEIRGVYVPFWLFDGEAEGSASFQATRTFTRRSGDYQITRTDHFNVYREGSVAFARIPVDGSKKMPDDYMDSIEPFDYGALETFSTAYLPGYFADKYDVSAEESSKRADGRAEATLGDCLRESVRGYTGVIERGKKIRLHRGAVRYALLPVWILNTKWENQDYLFAMNGQTGKFVGKLPTDKKKARKFFALAYGIAALITALIVLFPGGLWNLLSA